MESEKNNPLDLNNLPDEFSARENAINKQTMTQFEAGSSSSGQSSRKRTNYDIGKVYECRFCSLKFCKSQALGGHMNRHRQERETETLNRARQLVFSNDSMSTVHGLPTHHLGKQMVGPAGGFHQPCQQVVDPSLHFKPAYPTVPPVSMRPPATMLQHNHQHNNAPHQPYFYPSPPPRPHFVSYPSQYHHQPSNEQYCLGHVLGTGPPETSSYTCIGAPVVGPTGFGATNNGIRENGSTTMQHTNLANGPHNGSQDDQGLSWGMRGLGGTATTTTHQQLQSATRLDLASSVNRFHDGF